VQQCSSAAFAAMALATPPLILRNPSLASAPCRGASNEGRHAEVVREGAIVVRGEANQQWDCCRQACASRARVTCLLGGGGKRDAARKALEAALGEKKDAFSKWDEEIKKREEGGGGGKGRGRGWGSGGGGSGGGGGGGGDANFGGLPANRSNSWEDTKQMILAFVGLASLYLVLTQGKSMLAVSVNSALYVLRGFKKSGSSTSSRRQPALGRPVGDGPGPAESSVISKWGKD